jgi:hypothetical protein
MKLSEMNGKYLRVIIKKKPTMGLKKPTSGIGKDRFLR